MSLEGGWGTNGIDSVKVPDRLWRTAVGRKDGGDDVEITMVAGVFTPQGLKHDGNVEVCCKG